MTHVSERYVPILLSGTAIVFLVLGMATRSIASMFVGLALLQTAMARAVDHPGVMKGMILILSIWFFFMPPMLSDDHHRYLWEGHVQQQGYSPYRHSPEQLSPIVNHPSVNRVNHPELTAIYPPFAQLLFRICATLSPSIYIWKALIMLLGLVFFLSGGQQRWRVMASTLWLVEGVWNAHVDAIGMLAVCVMLACSEKGQSRLSGILMAIVVWMKLIPVLWLPFLLLGLKPRRWPAFMIGFAGSSALILLPYRDDIPYFFDSFVTFSTHWQFNSLLYQIGEGWIGGPATRLSMTTGFAVIYLGICIFAIYKVRSQGTPLTPRQYRLAMIWTWLALIMMSPTFYPWYLLWLVPLCHGPWLERAYLATFLSYFVLTKFWAQQLWSESWTWLVPEWIFLLLCFTILMKGKGVDANH